jgi:hypothetical protein
LKPISIPKTIESCGGVQYVMTAVTSAIGKVRCGIFAMLEKFTEGEILSAGGKIMPDTSNIDEMVQEILADMPLKEKAIIANLDEDKVPYLQHAFDVCISGQLCEDDEMGKDVMHRIWEILQETHRVRFVK